MLKFCRRQTVKLKERLLADLDPGRPALVTAAALFLTLLISLIFSAQFSARMVDDVYDLLLRSKASLEARTKAASEPPVAIIAIDDRTLAFGPMSVPELFQHQYYAEVVRAMHKAGAKAVVLTRLLPRSRESLSAPEDRQSWFAAVRDSRGMPVLSGVVWRGQRIILPSPDYLFAMGQDSFGFLNLKLDDDAQVRRLPVRWPGCHEGVGCRSLAWMAAKVVDPELPEPDDEIYINFVSRAESLPTYSFVEVYRRALALNPSSATALEQADFLRNFKDKIVLIGQINFMAQDIWNTPFSQTLKRGDSGVEIIAQEILTLLDGSQFWIFSFREQFFFILGLLALSLTPVLLSRRCGPYPGLWLPLILLPLFIGLSLPAFLNHVYLPVLPGAIALVLAQIFSLGVRMVEERAATRVSLAALSVYLDPKLAEQIVRHPELLAPGGKRHEMTVFFSDLVGFTALAEHISPEDLVDSLNRYFDRMEPIISRQGGIVDKYDGDSIMAFWGAPLMPRPDHAAAACLAALEQHQALSELNAKLRAEGHPPFSALMSLASGPMVVGNIGAERRLNYTVMGDAVNLASRLVAVNKIYQTSIIINDRTAAEAASAVELRALDRITVPGRRESLAIFEVMARKGDLDERQLEGRDLYERGLKLYFQREFMKALGLFDEALAYMPADGPSELMSVRCREFLRFPPKEDWAGVSALAVK